MALEFSPPDGTGDDDGDRTEVHKGPVTLRRDQIESSTTDQRLLESRGPSDWVHTDPWRVVTVAPVGGSLVSA